MTSNWGHVANDLARALLEGRTPADKTVLNTVLHTMLDEQSRDASNPMLREEIWWARDDALDRAYKHYKEGEIALCMNRIKTFYLT